MDTIQKLKDHYAFVALFKTGELVGVRNHEPLILGIDNNNLLLTSDVIGLPENISSVVYLDNGQFVIINKSRFKIQDSDYVCVTGSVISYHISVITKFFVIGKGIHYPIEEELILTIHVI